MAKPKLTYFDASTSRGEECRLALHLAGIDFEDHRIQFKDWALLKPSSPFGGLPILEIPGRVPLAQSNAILVFIGREHGLHPTDHFEAALHEAVMAHVEDLRAVIGPTTRMKDETEKRAAREALVASYIPNWSEKAEKQIAEGPFLGGPKLQVADLKLHLIVRWLSSGVLDHVPASILAGYPKLNRLHDAVRDDSRVKAWYEKRAAVAAS